MEHNLNKGRYNQDERNCQTEKINSHLRIRTFFQSYLFIRILSKSSHQRYFSFIIIDKLRYQYLEEKSKALIAIVYYNPVILLCGNSVQHLLETMRGQLLYSFNYFRLKCVLNLPKILNGWNNPDSTSWKIMINALWVLPMWISSIKMNFWVVRID